MRMFVSQQRAAIQQFGISEILAKKVLHIFTQTD